MRNSWIQVWEDSANAPFKKRVVMPNGLFKNSKKQGVFYGFYTTKDGKRKQFSTRTTVEREARKVFQRTLQAIWDEEDRPKLKITTLEAFTEEYLSSRRGEKISESQLKELRASLTFLQRALGDVPLHTITVQECERFIARGWKPEGWPSLWTARKHYTNLSAAFRTAQRWGHIRENPFGEIKKPRPVELLPEILTRRELALFFESLPDSKPHERRFRNIFLLLANTGLRLGEALNLEKRDVDFQKRELLIRVKRNWTPKSKKPRVVPLSGDAVKALRSQQVENARSDNERVISSPFIFPNPHGFPLTKASPFERPFAEIAQKLFPGRDLTPHSLRHSYASFLCECGVPLQEVQKILGHSSVKVTERYARLRGNDFSRALEALNAVPSLIRPAYQTPEGSETNVPECEEAA